MSILRSHGTTSWVEGTNDQFDARPERVRIDSSVSSIRPLPTITRRKPGSLWCTRANASARVSSPFSGRSAPTVPMTKKRPAALPGAVRRREKSIGVNAVVTEADLSGSHAFVIDQVFFHLAAIHHYSVHHAVDDPQKMMVDPLGQRSESALAGKHHRRPEGAGDGHGEQVARRVQRVNQLDAMLPDITAHAHRRRQHDRGFTKRSHRKSGDGNVEFAQFFIANAVRTEAGDVRSEASAVD